MALVAQDLDQLKTKENKKQNILKLYSSAIIRQTNFPVPERIRMNIPTTFTTESHSRSPCKDCVIWGAGTDQVKALVDVPRPPPPKKAA